MLNFAFIPPKKKIESHSQQILVTSVFFIVNFFYGVGFASTISLSTIAKTKTTSRTTATTAAGTALASTISTYSSSSETRKAAGVLSFYRSLEDLFYGFINKKMPLSHFGEFDGDSSAN